MSVTRRPQMIRPRPTGGPDVQPTPVALCATRWYEVFKQRVGATSVGPLTPILVWGRQGDCNESPTPQRDPKVMGKVRLTTEARNRTRNRSYISPTPCRLDHTVMGYCKKSSFAKRGVVVELG